VAIPPCKNRGGTSKALQEQQSIRWADELAESSEAAQPGHATLMVRNIACRYSKEDVIGFLAELGFDGAYDFFYLPLNSTKRSNLGYFFINFQNEADSNRCRECLQGKCLGTSQTQKRCDVSLAKVQGAKSISEHFHRKAVTRSPHAPIFLGEGAR
jgi:RNA recognition motif-containing protein